ncbi:anthranilate synthase component I family protein [Microbacterium sp. S1037]|uniref:anthranilate synthase component I family protein n=1 Tax=Microbacterium sp. S1037 TaxID=3398227 RepID=UPI003AAAF0DF
MPRSAPPLALPCWVDPETVFTSLWAAEPAAFWLDGGVDAETGWSWMGAGHRESANDPLHVIASNDSRGAFHGGWVGWIPYDGDPAWIRVDAALAFDHEKRRVWAVGTDAKALADLAERALAVGPVAAVAPAEPRGVASGRHEADEYAGLIGACREHIREGDAYQLCLTTRFTVPGRFLALDVFRRLRATSSSHHGGFVRIGDTALVSASPERFLEVRGGAVHTHPIKGTRPRATDPVVDEALAAELRTDAKEQAENVMIVDLMRNDLSRVCVPSSVGVDRLLEVESYPHVHQLVSEVSGRLRPGTTLGALVDAAFPAGSMTGAPKASAMTILEHLEGAPRGIYSGTFGWIGDDGSADLAMVIRSIVVEADAAHVGAGGGITWRSVAASEVAEVGIKARAPLAALGAQVPPGW